MQTSGCKVLRQDDLQVLFNSKITEWRKLYNLAEDEMIFAAINSNFNPEQIHSYFLQEHSCPVCEDKVSYKEMFSLACGHSFCRDCWKQTLEKRVDDNQCEATCLQQGCPVKVAHNTFLSLISVEKQQRYW